MQNNYQKLLATPQWQEKRKKILQRDGHRCRNCGSGNLLQAHHRQYHFLNALAQFKDPWDYNDKYLVTLCRECHQKGHQKFNIPVFNL